MINEKKNVKINEPPRIVTAFKNVLERPRSKTSGCSNNDGVRIQGGVRYYYQSF